MSRPLPILFGTLLLDTITIGILIPVIPLIFTNESSSSFMLAGYSVSEQYFVVGLVGAAFGLMQFIGAPILGELSDIYGRRKLLMICVALLAGANFLFAVGIHAASVAVLFVSRLIAGLAGANFSIAQAMIADVTTPENRARSFGLIGAAFGLGFIIGPLIGGWCANVFDNAAAPFWLAGGLGLMNVLFVTLALPETRRADREERERFTIGKGIRNIRHALRDAEAAPVYWISFLYMCGFAFFTTFVSVLLSQRYGFSEANTGTFFAVVGVCIVLTQVVVLPIVTKRVTERTTLLVGFPLVALTILGYVHAPSYLYLYALIPTMAIPQGIAFSNIGALISKSVEPEEQGAALGINGSLMAFSNGIVPLIAGLGTGVTGLSAPFYAGAILVMFAWLIVFRVGTSRTYLNINGLKPGA